MEERLKDLGDIIDSNVEVRGARWLRQSHEILDDSSEILMLHKRTDDGEDEYVVREYPLRGNTPHKQARLSERKWNGADPNETISQRSRRVFPGLRLDMERIGLEDHDIVWISRRIGRLLEKRSQDQVAQAWDNVDKNG